MVMGIVQARAVLSNEKVKSFHFDVVLVRAEFHHVRLNVYKGSL